MGPEPKGTSQTLDSNQNKGESGVADRLSNML